MNIVFLIESHVYEEERLRDEMLDESLGDDIESCGIVGPETIIPLRKKRNPKVSFVYTEQTTLGDAIDAIYNEYGYLELDKIFWPRIAFLYKGIRYWVDDIQANFQTIVNRYLDPQETGLVHVAIYVSADAGRICEENGIRYYMNSRERGKHNEPHIHLRALDSCEEAVIIIRTGEIIGDFPKKLIKKARKKVRENERFFFEQWNALTDGLKVDINRYLGLIKY